MELPFLERDTFLNTLNQALKRVVSESGEMILIAGEAGIGKTSLVERFLKNIPADTLVLSGACDALFTPRPMGPIYDMTRHWNKNIIASIDESKDDRIGGFVNILSALQDEGLCIVVIEDIHWADEATMDLIKYLGRRISLTKVLFIVTYRDDEIGRTHPLRVVLGDLHGAKLTRIAIPSLSLEAVNKLSSNHQLPGASVFTITDGNPFFVTEILYMDQSGVPLTVSDAVLARTSRLTPPARQLLELISCIPGRTERDLIDDIISDSDDELDECIEAGILKVNDSAITFRHELARRVVEESLPAGVLRQWHSRVLEKLRYADGIKNDSARIVHHASLAGDIPAVLFFAKKAAREAASLHAHREAASHYAMMLRYYEKISIEELADLYEQHSLELYYCAQMEESFDARMKAIRYWKRLDQPVREGDCLRWLSRISWMMGRSSDAYKYARQALSVLEPLPASSELAMAYSNYSQLHMLSEDAEIAISWGRKAIDMAEELGKNDILANALNNVGTATLHSIDFESGRILLERSLKISLENGYDDHAARAHINLSTEFVFFRQYESAVTYLNAGIAFCMDHDVDWGYVYMRSNLAILHLGRGQWAEAESVANDILENRPKLGLLRLLPLVVKGLLKVRKGEIDGKKDLDVAMTIAKPSEEIQRIGIVAAAKAEAAWLTGDLEACRREAEQAYDLAVSRSNGWYIGILAFWIWKSGGNIELPARAAVPYARQILGDWFGAAEEWEKIGCPYEQALALSDGNTEARLHALDMLKNLGAVATAKIVEHDLRDRGVRRIPRGPRRSTLANPRGLTPREMEIIPLLIEGLQNKEIAEKLFISAKTVDHHISSIPQLGRTDSIS
jgi:DNA-binding CsgD family transcriptional regulator/tetratricopeptide (TPR) repeat protein